MTTGLAPVDYARVTLIAASTPICAMARPGGAALDQLAHSAGCLAVVDRHRNVRRDAAGVYWVLRQALGPRRRVPEDERTARHRQVPLVCVVEHAARVLADEARLAALLRRQNEAFAAALAPRRGHHGNPSRERQDLRKCERVIVTTDELSGMGTELSDQVADFDLVWLWHRRVSEQALELRDVVRGGEDARADVNDL